MFWNSLLIQQHTNTAVDVFLLEKAIKGQFILSFTNWLPSVLIGNSQSLVLDVDQEACQERNVSIMRRFFGGQSVYLDENYIVFTIAGPRSLFPEKINELRKQACLISQKVLNRFNVPAVFYEPDNLVILGKSIKTLGNSGQVIKRDAVSVGVSICYDLPDKGLKEMLDVLMINGKKLNDFFDQIKKALSSIKEFTNIESKEIKMLLIREITKNYGRKEFFLDKLSNDEKERVNHFSEKMFFSNQILTKFFVKVEFIIEETRMNYFMNRIIH